MRNQALTTPLSEARRGEAVVIGAGLAGLLAGRVLARRFERVAILDRDGLPDEARFRKGVPQGRHLHSLATRGSELLERLFPGLDAELGASGAPLLDQTADTITEMPAGRMPRFESGITMRAASRPLLEGVIRARVREDSAVHFVTGTEATGLLSNGGAVTGVKTRGRGGRSGETGELAADLVVDASGQGSRAPRWLSELGCGVPGETVVDAGLGYASRWYRVPEDFDEGWLSLAVLPGWPDNPRGGTLRRVEGGLWTAVLTGSGGDYPPTDPARFVEFAASLPSPIIHEAISAAEPVSPVYGYRRTANRRLHYEKMDLPAGFLVMGDAATTLNPSYGTGMTAAALAAGALEGCLADLGTRRGRRQLSRLGRRFQRRQVKAVSPCWTTTTSNDAQWTATGVEYLNAPRRLAHGVSEQVMALATESKETVRTMFEVKNVLRSPAAMLRPGIFAPALWRTLSGGNTTTKPPAIGHRRSLDSGADGPTARPG